MDAVYDDFDFAMKNVRLDDGDAQYVNPLCGGCFCFEMGIV